MQLFSTYYNGVPISFVSNVNEELAVNHLLNNKKVEHFFSDASNSTFISTKLINNYRYINRYLHSINRQLNQNDYFFGYFETFSARKGRIHAYKVPLIKYFFLILDFLINRVLPKIKYLNEIYFFFNKGRNRVLSKAEVLGRLVCCGFEIVQVENIDRHCYFKARKIVENPLKQSSSYGIIFKMKRIGKNNKLFNLYKFRTMHPFSEYLQDYMLEKHGFSTSGKIERDFRLTIWGKWLRKFWLDEIPQIFNVIKGDMKLVGVRPVSQSYFNKLPEDFKKIRNKFKPGCIPPYVALDFKSSFEEVIKAEKIYIEKKMKQPYITDIKFFFYAIINIVLRGKRSS